ncbi:BlaI/MecI/CopY family transcriptional regulator [Pseudoteredinibacter isoporae]|uniref:BlaI family penicillinase repressor n=1 Tax=Pseudoteredinibacter isoporae TaxID=570281 RepID=A0A7X0JRE1_9GAMM|nr:BlaI/MecI/CopY family transcriptional regulator [Pseudoteredinibacter isoporae]MBB6520887.1 BlaI family penicillinase repressor [Pseudoteredinibacter isoporae]NHO86452.1 BlaI/MecI/CopY family transcriptional regulator [Pseudoteredinibacter isoporae]NIB25096.1 BlaI/MecI/CopY family transcriptional regulator [Pseudoteredinibacter isoporae]
MEFSDFELEVMHHFWEQSTLSAPQVHQAIEQKRDISYSAVKTIIDRLEKKGALNRAGQEGRTIYYSASVERGKVRLPMIKQFINKVFLGKSQNLAVHLLEEEELSLDDIQYLEKILKQRKKALKDD